MSDSFSSPESPVSAGTTAAAGVPPQSDSTESLSLKVIESLANIITTTPIPATLPLLLNDPSVSTAISSLLRLPDSGAGDNNLCRWLYDTFQSSDPSLQLFVLRFVPIVAGLYLSRVPLRCPQAGFEAVLLALYAHETTARAGQALTVNIPDLSHPSLYHESKGPTKNNSTCLNIAVVSPTLEPYGTVRSTRRARIMGVALELYHSKITRMPRESKLDFCQFCKKWAGQNGETHKDPIGNGNEDETNNIKSEREGRIHLPWELLQPVLRILGHCMLGKKKDEEDGDGQLFEAASRACQSLYLRSLHDLNPKAILATGSLLRLREMVLEPENQIDYTDIPNDTVISI